MDAPPVASSSYDIFEPRTAKTNHPPKNKTKAKHKGQTPFRVKSPMLGEMLLDGTSGESTETTTCTTLEAVNAILRHAKRHSLLQYDDRTICLDDHMRALLQSPPTEKYLPLYLLPKRIYDTLLVSTPPPQTNATHKTTRKTKSKTA